MIIILHPILVPLTVPRPPLAANLGNGIRDHFREVREDGRAASEDGQHCARMVRLVQASHKHLLPNMPAPTGWVPTMSCDGGGGA